MPFADDTTQQPDESPKVESVSIRISADVWRELRIASAYRLQPINDLVALAWDAFKREQGKHLHDPQEKKQS